MTRGVDDVHAHVFPGDGTVFGKNGNAPLALLGVRIHDAVIDLLAGTEDTGLVEKAVNQGGFTVVNVGNDGDIAEIGAAGFVHGAR